MLVKKKYNIEMKGIDSRSDYIISDARERARPGELLHDCLFSFVL